MRRTTHTYTIGWPDGDQVVREGPAGLREHGKWPQEDQETQRDERHRDIRFKERKDSDQGDLETKRFGDTHRDSETQRFQDTETLTDPEA